MTPFKRELAVVAVLTLLAFSLAWQTPGPISLDIGAPDEIYLTAFESPESNTTRDYRWSTQDSDIHLPGVGVADWRVTLVAATGARPHGPVPLTIQVGGETVLAVPAADPDFYAYHFTVPAHTLPSGDLQLDLLISAYRPPGENRRLALAVDRVTLEPVGSRLPPPLTLFWLTVALTLFYATARMAWPWRGAGALTLPAMLLLSGLIAFAPLLITPYASYLALFAVLGYSGVYTLRATLRRYAPHLAAFPTEEKGVSAQSTHPVPLPDEDGIAVISGAPAELGEIDRSTSALSTPNPVLALTLAVLIGYALASFTAGIVFLARKPLPDDFVTFYRAAGRILAGQPLYQLADLHNDPLGAWYKYPPLFALLLTPLTRLPLRTALEVWNGLNLAALATAIWAVTRAHGRRWSEAAPPALLFAALALLFQPVLDTLIYGQMDLVLLGLLALTYLALRTGHPAWAGPPLALAIGFKVYPALLLLYLLLRRDWRALASCALAGGALLLGSLPFTGLAPWQTFVTTVLIAGNGATAWVENVNFGGFLSRLLIDRFDLVPFPPNLGWRSVLVSGGTLAWALGLLGVSAWAVGAGSWRVPRTSATYALGFALTTAVSFMALPNAWYHYLTLLLLPLGVALFVLADLGSGWWVTARRPLTGVLVGLGSAAVGLAVGSFPLVWPGLNLGGPWKLVLSYKFYAALVLLGCLIWMLRAARRASQN